MALLAPRLLWAAVGKAMSSTRVVCRLPTTIRAISTTPSAYFKLYQDIENSFAYSILRSRKELQSTLVSVDPEPSLVSGAEFQTIVNSDWSQESPEEIAKAFERVSFYGTQQSLCIADSVFDGICDAVKSKCIDMQDEDLFRVLRALALWGPSAESLDTKNFNMWKDLDEVCTSRTKLWSKKTVLYVADHWYNLKIMRGTKFLSQGNRKLARKPSTLSTYELVQAMFYLNVFRKHTSVADMYEYEFCFEKKIDEMSIDEIAIFAMAFFKSQTRMYNEALLSKIIDRTIESANTVDPISLAAILKTLRYCVRLSLGDKLWALLDILQKEVPRVTLLTCVHIALLGTNTQVFHAGAIKAVCERAVKEIGSFRVKDLERLALALALFNYNPETIPCIYEKIAEELQNPERAEEFKQYPKCVPRCLHFLSQRNIYLPEAIARVIDPDFLKETYGKDRYMVALDIVALDVGVELECPAYSGPRLELKTRRIVSKRYNLHMPTIMKKSTPVGAKMLREIFDATLIAAGSSSRVCAIHLLPHFPREDVVLRLGPAGRPVEIPKEFLEDRLGSVVRPVGGASGDCWCVLHVGVHNAYVRETDQLIGSVVAHLRQLQSLGYRVTVVPWYEWIRLAEEGRSSYINKIVNSLAQGGKSPE